MTEHMSDDDLARGESLAEEATPGPWYASPYWRGNPSDGPTLHTIRSRSNADDPRVTYEIAQTDYDEAGWRDAEFIAFARAALPALIAEVREYRAGEVEYGEVAPYGGDDGETVTLHKPFYGDRGRPVGEGFVLGRRVVGPWEVVTDE